MTGSILLGMTPFCRFSFPAVSRFRFDGMLIFPDNKEVAIEVELTLKSKRRLREIFHTYIACLQIKETWYYCSPNITERLRKLAERIDCIKFYDLDNKAVIQALSEKIAYLALELALGHLRNVKTKPFGCAARSLDISTVFLVLGKIMPYF